MMAMAQMIKFSLIIPVYKNSENLPFLLPALTTLAKPYGSAMEVIFVVDGSPDSCFVELQQACPTLPFATQLITHSRNFGSFAAIRTGLKQARGEYFACMAADLQEPPELIHEFFLVLAQDEADVVMGQRTKRQDPWAKRLLANTFWRLYRRFILPEMPVGGVDIFGCNQSVRQVLLQIEEPKGALIAQLFWIGFRRRFIAYERQARQQGKSAWGLRRRLHYMLDSIFSYSELPILWVLWIGGISFVVSAIVTVLTLLARLSGLIQVSGYTTLVLLLVFFSSAILMMQGILGCYIWRIMENTKKRPLSIVASSQSFMPSVIEEPLES